MIQSNDAALAVSRMNERGLQSWFARKSGCSRATVTMIFRGNRNCTPKQAAIFEDLFLRKAIPLNRWDLLYGRNASKTNPVSLSDYLRKKLEK